MRIGKRDVERMNHRFTADGDGPRRIYGSMVAVDAMHSPVGWSVGAIRALAADLITTREGPCRKGEMQRFVAGFPDSPCNTGSGSNPACSSIAWPPIRYPTRNPIHLKGLAEIRLPL